MKLLSYNVNGLRAILSKGFAKMIAAEQPDIFCIQETRLSEDHVRAIGDAVPGYFSEFAYAQKKGYSGVATFVSSKLRKNNPPLDSVTTWYRQSSNKTLRRLATCSNEGRVLVTPFKKFRLYNIYFPSGTSGDLRQQVKYDFLDEFFDYLKKLPDLAKEQMIICGDFNICHRDIDIHHPREAEKRQLTGFLPAERAWMDKFEGLGFVDCFRRVHGEIPAQYTWWTYRAGARGKNLGWRIDYFWVSTVLAKKIKEANILNDVHGSDHCPITLEIDI